MASDPISKLRGLVAHAKTKVPCAVHYGCLMSEVEALLPALEQQQDAAEERIVEEWQKRCRLLMGDKDVLNRKIVALEQRERELRLDEALKFQAALFDAEFVFKFAEKRVAELRTARTKREA